MKKFLIIVLTIALCCGAMLGCNSNQHSGGGENDGTFNEQSTGKSGDATEGENLLDVTTSKINIETPPDNYVYKYDSYTEIGRALSLSSSDEYRLLHSKNEQYGLLYTNTLKRFSEGNEIFYIPVMDGKPIALRNIEGYSGVSLMTCELYNLPWIWYHCTLGNANLDIKISYPGALERTEIEAAETYLDILKLIAPDAPSPSNYQQYESYKTIYEKEVTLANGRVVTAMISEMNNTSKVYVMLLLNDILISMYGDVQVFSDGFWESFGLAEYNET